MRLLLFLSFCIGLVLKLLHLPYHTVFLLAVLAVSLPWCLVQLQRGMDKALAWATLAAWGWAAHLVALLKLFPFRTGTLALAIVLSLIALVIMVRQRPLPTRPLLLMAGAFLLVMLAMAFPTSDRFHFTNLRFSVERDTDYHSWDKYSFFLMREGRSADALLANSQAVEAAMEVDATDAITALEGRRVLIEEGTWERYHSWETHPNAQRSKSDN